MCEDFFKILPYLSFTTVLIIKKQNSIMSYSGEGNPNHHMRRSFSSPIMNSWNLLIVYSVLIEVSSN